MFNFFQWFLQSATITAISSCNAPEANLAELINAVETSSRVDLAAKGGGASIPDKFSTNKTVSINDSMGQHSAANELAIS
jgi:hypothetical protein